MASNQSSDEVPPRIGPDGSGLKHYYFVKSLGAGNFGVAKLFKAENGASCAIKFLPRGDKINKNVEREVLNHRTLVHPNIVAFREVFLTSSHLGIVMEYASGGELFDRITRAKRFNENEARYFFQQLVSGIAYCHSMGVCHRDLKLENILLDGRHAPQVKICDFGYSKSNQDSNPKSTVGTPAYIAPEVLRHVEYDGQAADVWSCGVTLYVMLVGAYPFEDPAEPNNFRSTMQRITAAQYVFPPGLRLSVECLDLVAHMLRPDPSQRITVDGIRAHPWFRLNLPSEVADPVVQPAHHLQSEEEIQHIVNLARTPPMATPRRMDLSRDVLDSMHGHISTQAPSPQQGARPTDKWHGPPTPQQQHAGVAGRQHTVTKYAAAMAAHQAAHLAANQEAALQQEAQRAAHQAAAAAQQQQGLKQGAVAQALKQPAVAQAGALQGHHQVESPKATPPPRGGLSFNMRSPMALEEEPPPRRSQGGNVTLGGMMSFFKRHLA